MSRSRLTRVLRASVAASIATFAALVSHVAAGGAMPEPLGLLAPWVLSLFVCTVLAGKTLSLARLSIAVFLSQLLFHTLFVLGAPAAASAGPAVGHVHGALTLDLSGTSPVIADASMWLAHALAAAVTVAALYRAERALQQLSVLAQRLIHWLGRRIARASGSVRIGFEHPVRIGVESRTAALFSVTTSSVRRRGPPLAIVV